MKRFIEQYGKGHFSIRGNETINRINGKGPVNRALADLFRREEEETIKKQTDSRQGGS